MLRITDEGTSASAAVPADAHENQSRPRGRLNRGIQGLLVEEGALEGHCAPSGGREIDGDEFLDDAVAAPIRFERRRGSRVPTSGWAQVICQDPYHTFLGGAMQLADVSEQAVGLIGTNRVGVGELVEVRLAPFRCRGRIGRVVRCDQLPVCRVPTVRLLNSAGGSGPNEVLADPGADERRYKVAVHFGRNVVAA